MQKPVIKSQYRILSARQMFRPGELPLRLHYTTSSEMTGFHVHEFSEIAVVLSGTASYRTDFSERRIRQGDVLCIPENAGHAYSQENNCELMNILFQFDRLPIYCRELVCLPGFSVLFTLRQPFYQRYGFYPVVHLPEPDFSRCDSMLRWLNQLQNANTRGAQIALLGGFMQLITLLVNHYSPPQVVDRELNIPEKLSDSIFLMQTHYTKPLSVGELARRAGMSEASYFRHFRQATGQTPIDYLLSIRLNQAAELLKSDPYAKIFHVAARCGFRSGDYFSRMFQRHFGMSPRQFRKQMNS